MADVDVGSDGIPGSPDHKPAIVKVQQGDLSSGAAPAYARTLLYHFEFRGEAGWEAFGSGEGSGEDPVAVAMADLTAVCGDRLPEGEYRAIAPTSESPRWESLWLDAGGRIADPDAVESTASLQE